MVGGRDWAAESFEFAIHKSQLAESPTLVIVPPSRLSRSEGELVARLLSESFDTFVLLAEIPKPTEVEAYLERFVANLGRLKVKRATVLGIGAGGGVAQALAIRDPKFVRRLVLLNATTRIEPGLLLRIVDKLERALPLGLPLRALSETFDSRPYLHRIRCPVLILTQPHDTMFLERQAKLMAKKIPNAWVKILPHLFASGSLQLSPEAVAVLREFLQVPTKRPQKNLILTGNTTG